MPRRFNRDDFMPPSSTPTQTEGKASDPEASPAPSEGGEGGATRISVKLDDRRYRLLRGYGVDHRLTNQAIMVKALDEFMARHGLIAP